MERKDLIHGGAVSAKAPLCDVDKRFDCPFQMRSEHVLENHAETRDEADGTVLFNIFFVSLLLPDESDVGIVPGPGCSSEHVERFEKEACCKSQLRVSESQHFSKDAVVARGLPTGTLLE